MSKESWKEVTLCGGIYTYDDVVEQLDLYRTKRHYYKENRGLLTLRQLISLRDDLVLLKGFFCDIEPEVKELADNEKIDIDSREFELVKKLSVEMSETKAKVEARYKTRVRRKRLNDIRAFQRRLYNIYDKSIPGLENTIAARIREKEDHTELEDGQRVPDAPEEPYVPPSVQTPQPPLPKPLEPSPTPSVILPGSPADFAGPNRLRGARYQRPVIQSPFEEE